MNIMDRKMTMCLDNEQAAKLISELQNAMNSKKEIAV